MQVVDPVCGMAMEEKDVSGTTSYKGTTYYFCSNECKENFDKDPEALLGMKQAREKIAEEERTEALEKVMYEVSHEVRNPLTSIGGFVRRVYERLPEGDFNKNYLEMVLEDVARLEKMIKQLIDLVTTSVLHRETVDVNDVITDALKLFRKEIEEQGIEVKTELVKNPPPIYIDREKMTVAFANLIRNAIEAMQRIPKVLAITNYLTKEYIEVKLSDTGKGIPQDKVNKVFDPFFSSKIYGPGIGLTFSQRIIQQHGGTISVESKHGKGTTFTIRLPLIE